MSTNIHELISKILSKKELSGIDSSIVKETLEEYLKKQNISIDSLSPSEIKLVIKDIRSKLRIFSGRFREKINKSIPSLSQNEKSDLLNSHASTKERLPFYEKLKNLLKELKVSSVLDLGSGINPIALANPSLEYYACDINQEDISSVNSFFKENQIKGNAFICDIRKVDSLSLPKTDIALLFKVFDVLETRGHKLAEKIIQKIPSRYLLISFPTKTLSGKPMNHPQRGWIERLLVRLGYSFKTLKSSNEIFYLAEKIIRQ